MNRAPVLSTCDAHGRILLAAEILFSEHGFNAVSINAIALRAGVSKANVFHHFNTKDALYLAVLNRARQGTASHLRNLEHSVEPFASRLGSFSGNHLARLLEQKQLSRLILRELLTIGPHRAHQLAEQVFEENFRRFVRILRAGQRSGELRADLDPAMVATILLGANVFFFEVRTLLRHFRDVSFAESPERFTDMLIEILLRGAGPPQRQGHVRP
ncbi:MAG: TetR/AcrR family transcriptional regulator, partial [Acidiferrobacterales bacterium]